MFCPYFQYGPCFALNSGIGTGLGSDLSDVPVSAVFSADPMINPYYAPTSYPLWGARSNPYLGGNIYITNSDDTLYGIAGFYNISPDDLIEANPRINPDNLLPGQALRIPLTQSSPACPQGAQSYVVQKGDTYYSISKRFNITISALSKSNPGVNPDGLLVGQMLCIPRSWNSYSNPAYNVTFMYPLRWRRVDDTRYEGMDGFFHISAIASDSPWEQVCKNEAVHKLKPYGSAPNITPFDFKGQPACFILPSEDQPQEMKEQSALIIRYPKPVVIKGQPYNYFILWADKSHIRKIADSLKFLVR